MKIKVRHEDPFDAPSEGEVPLESVLNKDVRALLEDPNVREVRVVLSFPEVITWTKVEETPGK